MKNYFNFTLTGKKLLPIWILVIVLLIAPYITFIIKMTTLLHQDSSVWMVFSFIFLLVVIAFVLTFYIARLVIENVSFQDKTVEFNGKFWNFIGIFLLGILLSVITLGIYTPWFTRDIHRFFIDNSSYDSTHLKFQGKGGKLLVILLLTLLVPMIIFQFVLMKYGLMYSRTIMFNIIHQMVMMIIMIPYIYFLYKWTVNIDYKGYNISWNTNAMESCGKIAIEMILMMLTLGIYIPLGWLRLYKYFADRTIMKSDEKQMKFGYEIAPLNDFLLIWGQILLTIITLGIYYPWACCKIGQRILSKTYLEIE